MAARTRPLTTLLTHLRPHGPSTTAAARILTAHTQPFHTHSPRPSPATTTIPSSSTQNTSTNPARAASAANTPMSPFASESNTSTSDPRAASYLGEADANETRDAHHLVDPPPQPALDASNAAYLGEADSDDGFEAHRSAHGVTEAVDAEKSAFLGEADSDDGFESDVEVYPERHVHKFDEDAVRGSGEHGQPGEGDR